MVYVQLNLLRFSRILLWRAGRVHVRLSVRSTRKGSVIQRRHRHAEYEEPLKSCGERCHFFHPSRVEERWRKRRKEHGWLWRLEWERAREDVHLCCWHFYLNTGCHRAWQSIEPSLPFLLRFQNQPSILLPFLVRKRHNWSLLYIFGKVHFSLIDFKWQRLHYKKIFEDWW